MRAPYPWFGGKSRVANIVWREFGDVSNYVEPFAGSLAVLLGRPECHKRSIETVNDKDGYVCNFWRALAGDPEAVIQHCDWPVNEADLTSRHHWLVGDGRTIIERVTEDADYYDAKVAGWWVWGICAWIGTGWCSGTRTSKRPHLGDRGMGVHRQRPHLGNRGMGVHRQGGMPDELRDLADRLRRVRVCCGDWERVVTDGATACGATVGVFLDPPYDLKIRAKGCYNQDEDGLAVRCREWALGKTDDPRFRVILCGYEEEHAEPMAQAGWRMVAWKAQGGYSNPGTPGEGNARKERLWLSPSCLGTGAKQGKLW